MKPTEKPRCESGPEVEPPPKLGQCLETTAEVRDGGGVPIGADQDPTLNRNYFVTSNAYLAPSGGGPTSVPIYKQNTCSFIRNPPITPTLSPKSICACPGG